ncbi:MAG TPA: response regulator transcription factor [Rhodoferax sp.]|jgi:DNA-binding response OmpR family regulator|nr:response regulator transcription factor [Rhodoferax sp.]HNV59607.1 response regulator transcription factor [Rhodoferax sp.]HPW29220.1 response regulator transcription factor [Rhodoferax sp.]
MKSILLVEDDADLREELTDYLGAAGYSVCGVGSVADAERALTQSFELLILDINLPDGSGLELCRRVRPYIRSGIVICTGRSERHLRIDGLKDGADAYLVKPIDLQELEATLYSLLRRLAHVGTTLLSQAPPPVQWRLDRTRQTLAGPNGKSTQLSRSDCLLLSTILQSSQQQASRADVLAAFSHAGATLDGRKIEVQISRLRGKVLEQTGSRLPLQPIYGKGYVFTDHAELI